MSFILLKEKDLEMTEEEKDRIHTILERIAMVIGAFIFFLFFANFAIIFFEDLFFNGPTIEVVEEIPIPCS